MKKDDKCVNLFMLLIFTATIIVTIFSLFTHGLTVIHSDNAVEMLALNSILDNKNLFPNTWVYANGDINIMRTQIFLLLPYLFIKDWSIARMMGSLLILVFAALSICYMSKRIFHNNSWLLIIPLFLILLPGVYDVVLYLGMYSGTMIYITVIPTMYYWWIYKSEHNSIVKIISYLTISTLVFVGGIRWIAEIALPLVITLGIHFLIDITKMLKRNWGVLKVVRCGLYFLPMLIGFIINRYIRSNHYVLVNQHETVQKINGLKDLIHQLKLYIVNIYKCFGLGEYNSIYVYIIGTLICLIIPMLELFKIREEDEASRFYLIFAYMHNLVLSSAAIVFGNLYPHHLCTIVFVNIIISSFYVYKYILHGSSVAPKMGGVMLVLVTSIYSAIGLISMSNGWKESYELERQISRDLVENGFEKGYGEYWNAYNNELFSNGKIQIGAIGFSDTSFNTYYCLNDINVYKDSKKSSFIIFTKEEFEQFGDRAVVLFGTPSYDAEYFDIPKYEFHEDKWESVDYRIYGWDYDIGPLLSNGCMDGVLHPNELFFNWCGTMTKDSIIMDQGGIVNGPYSIIYDGEYTVKVVGENVDNLLVNIYSESYPESIIYQEIERNNNYINIKLSVKNAVDDINFALWNQEDSQVVLNKIDILKQ